VSVRPGRRGHAACRRGAAARRAGNGPAVAAVRAGSPRPDPRRAPGGADAEPVRCSRARYSPPRSVSIDTVHSRSHRVRERAQTQALFFHHFPSHGVVLAALQFLDARLRIAQARHHLLSDPASETTKATRLGRPRWTALWQLRPTLRPSVRGFPRSRRRRGTPPSRTEKAPGPQRARRSRYSCGRGD
jgi:hypothetical protein